MTLKTNYKKLKRILIRPRPIHEFPDHEVEYQLLYKMFDEKDSKIKMDGSAARTLEFLLAVRDELQHGNWPHYKYRLYTNNVILKNFIDYLDGK